jgi:hypothetical protein
MKGKILIALLFVTTGLFAQDFDLGKILKKEKYSSIQLEKFISGHLHLNMKINGVEGRFILDTGAGATVIENTVYEKFKLNIEDSAIKGAGAGGTNMNLKQSAGNKVVIKGVKKSDVTLYVMDLSHVNDAMEKMDIEPVDGVIGADLLKEYGMIIDYPNLMLYYK